MANSTPSLSERGQHTDHEPAENNGQGHQGVRSRAAGSSTFVGNKSGGESQNGVVPASRRNADISTERRVK
jgi:hypothetical protein